MGFISSHALQSNNFLFSRRQSSPIRENRLWRRRRLKLSRKTIFRNQLSLPFENLFPLMNSLDLIVPALGIASGAALYLSRSKFGGKSKVFDLGEWMLFTSPTPFNRFVILRCPSITFEGNELLEDVSEELVDRGRRFEKLSSGRIQVRDVSSEEENKIEYQRVFVGTDDGGVISLDWPVNLDLRKEHGLDTTVLLVPGTTEGSMERSVQSFVSECLGRGCFPIVMNPRGCAGSLLTTARLFTAADSDDLCMAVQFINNARPWTTLMGVGWGYGANILTKYLAEVGEKTPLTAAICIDNPFDLEDITRSSKYSSAINQKLTDGLINILRSNKGLFHDREKRFDVEKALLAKSVRDFEKAISMVSYGFNVIEDFYSECSTQGAVGNVKIPLLFIQNDDGTVPMFSIPRSLIAENPYTSLLLCSSSPSGVMSSGRSIMSWCQHCAIEWLMAVELGLLKGRHPLLEDVDVTIKPSKILTRVEEEGPSDKVVIANNPPPLTQSNVLNVVLVEEGDNPPSIKMPELEEEGLRQVDNDVLQQTNSINTELFNDDEVGPVDNEIGQVLQTTQVVMNMLDVTMPDTLAEEQKEKVLAAVEQGETLMKALQDAVPEDVRGKLTTAVTGILQGTNINLDKLKTVSSGLKSKIHENPGKLSSGEILHQDPFGHKEMAGNMGNESDKNHPGPDQPSGEQHLEFTSEISQKTSNHDQGPSTSGDGHGEPITVTTAESSGNESVSNSKEHRNEVGHDGLNIKDNSIEQVNEVEASDSIDQGTMSPSTMAEESHHPSQDLSSDAQVQGNDIQKSEEENSQPVLNETNSAPSVSNPPKFSVSQALDALAGMDDSTQVAVNNVFGVIESMINHLEEGYDKDGNGDRKSSMSDSSHFIIDKKLENKPNGNTTEGSLHDDISHDSPACSTPDNEMELQTNAIDKVDEKSTQNYNSSTNLMENKQKETEEDLASSRLLVENTDRNLHLNKVPLYIGPNSYEEYLHNDHLQKYPRSKLSNSKSLDLDATSPLLLDFIPENGKWTLLEKPENAREFNHVIKTRGTEKKFQVISKSSKENGADSIKRPPYVTINNKKQKLNPVSGEYQIEDYELEKVMLYTKNAILDSLKVEVSRRLSAVDMKEMESDLAKDVEQVANAVFIAVQYDEEHAGFQVENVSEKNGIRNRDRIMKAISFAVHNTTCLRRVLPFGVIVGSILAAMKKDYTVRKTDNALDNKETLNDDHGQVRVTKVNHVPSEKADKKPCIDISMKSENDVSRNGNVMVGAVTAALGATALFSRQQDPCNSVESSETSSKSISMAVNSSKQPKNTEDDDSDKNQSNVVSSLAEKAMLVAGPVVPKKEDGELDHDRLVAMLADWGQQGGMLRLVGKLALLWGGIRGAMSLTDKLISFLRVAERPLFQRILAFVGMVLVIWSPVLVPLLPTLVQGWATHNSSKIAEFACIVGLYSAIMILVMLWGRRIRGYDNPLEQYGLDFASSPKIENFVKAFFGGVTLVLLIHSVNAILGCVSLSCPSSLLLPSSSLVSAASIKVYGKMLLLGSQGILTATSIALVEELLFRSWLPAEIATDIGYRRGIIISGLAFSLLQRSPEAIPGLWLLSMGLAGARQRSQGSLAIPVGLRSGIMTVSYVLQTGGFVTYHHNLPFWVTGTHPFQPFSGVVGFAFSLILAMVFYPKKKPLQSKKMTRSIRE